MKEHRDIGAAAWAVALGLLALLAASSTAHAESEVWLRTRVQGEVHEDVSLSYDQQFKWMNRPEQLDRWQHTFTLDYGPTSWLTLGVGYRLTAKPSDRDQEDVCCIHRPIAQVELRAFKWEGLKLTARLRGQTRHKSGDPMEPMARARLKLSWKLTGWLRPYLSEETFWEPGADEIDSQRLDLGAQVHLHKTLRLGGFVRREFTPASADTTIYGANATYRW